MSPPETLSLPQKKENRPGANSSEIWRFRELLWSLVIRDIKVKYQRSILGLFWTLLSPLMILGVLVIVFSYVVRIPIHHYWAFLISGYFIWNYFQQTLYVATSIFRDNSVLNRSVYFPREILILAAAISRLVEFLVEFSVAVGILLIFHHSSIPASATLLPLVLFSQLVMAVALMFPITVIATMFYDVPHMLPIVIMSLFYLSPVFYPVEMVPESLQTIYHINPLAGILRMAHIILYEGAWPSWGLTLWVLATSMGLFWLGAWIFNRYKGVCVEIA